MVRIKHRLGVGLLLIQLAACSTTPTPPVGPQEALKDTPPALSQVPAVTPAPAPTPPRPEFVPVASDKPLQEGRPTWYKRSKFTHTTATGEALDDRLFTAAHLTLPLGSYLRVIDTATGNSVIVRVNDRGPYSRTYIIDLSKSAADALGVFRNPKMIVRLEPLSGVPATPVPVSTLPTGAAALAALGGKPKAAVKKPASSKPVAAKSAPAKPKAVAAKPVAKKPPPPKP
ncbi:MAG: septal ring lytic transglycosylase RlpA family protein [Elstera sp.]